MQRSTQAAPVRVRLRRLAPPKSLAALLSIVTVLGLMWALAVPPWQSPDELDHFAYTQSLGERFALPGDPKRSEDSSAEAAANGAVGAARTAFYPSTSPPDWNASDYAAYLASERLATAPTPLNGGGPNGADSNPPLYYLYATVPYLLGGNAFSQLYGIRIAGVLLLLTTTLAAWLLAGEVFDRRRLPQLTCAAVAGLLPMTTFISTANNPDAMLIAAWTVALWLGARVINHQARRGDVIALAAATAVAILTKATSYALVVPVLVAVGLGWWRRPRSSRRRGLPGFAAAAALLAVPVIGWLILARSLGRAGINSVATTTAHPASVIQFISYLWQFYLPKPPFFTSFRMTPQLPVYDIWLRQAAGTFGWLDVLLPAWMYPAAAVAAVAIAVGAVVALSRRLARRHLALLSFFALTLLALLALLHVSEYLLLIDGSGQFLQGRYLLPVVSLLGLAVATIVRVVPRRVQALAGAAVLVILLGVQVISLSSIVHAYYL